MMPMTRLTRRAGSISARVLFTAGALGLAILLWTWRPVYLEKVEENTTLEAFTPSEGLTAPAGQVPLLEEMSGPIRLAEPGRGGSAPAAVDAALVQARTREWLEHLMSPQFIENELDNPARLARALEVIRDAAPHALGEIHGFLEQSRDLVFPEGPRRSVGFPSLRAVLFDALHRAGTQEAEATMLQVFRTTADPREVGQLAGYLGSRPEYREEVLASAREMLREIAQPGPRPEEVGPLFDALRKFGDERVIEDLRQALPQWSHYAAIAMATLPGGRGILPLLEEAQNPAQRKPVHYLLTFRLLAQASHLEEAARGLVQMAQQGQIPPQGWLQLEQGLTSAHEYEFGKATDVRRLTPRSPSDLGGWKTAKVSNTGQDFFSRPLNAEADTLLIESRLHLIEQLAHVTSDPKALESLQRARQVLTGGKSRVSAEHWQTISPRPPTP
jgi:hypothetical protein